RFVHAMRFALQVDARGQVPCLDGGESLYEAPGCFSELRHARRLMVPTKPHAWAEALCRQQSRRDWR
ncbi:MAG: hypothetical protein OXC07_02995, partial [Kistimonas sp.]|nr:hypothetical protein [Kistimonas sp.]